MPCDAPPMPAVLWMGAFFSDVSYPRVAREYALALDRMGLPVRIQATDIARAGSYDGITGGDRETLCRLQRNDGTLPGRAIGVLHHPPEAAFPDLLPTGVKVLYTTFEGDGDLSPFAGRIAAFDETWVPSRFNRAALIASGVPGERVHVIPHGVRAELFRPGAEPGRPDSFTFLSVSVTSRRKGFDLLLRAFAEEFPLEPRVILAVKTAPTRWALRFWKQASKTLSDLGMAGRVSITFLRDCLDDHDMARIYRSADAFVVPARAEGFGLCFLEAMACGVPVVAPRWSGVLDFLDPEWAFLVEVDPARDSDGRPIPTAEAVRREGGLYAEPRLPDLRRRLREVFRGGDEVFRRRLLARRIAVERFSWERAARRIAERARRLQVPGDRG